MPRKPSLAHARKEHEFRSKITGRFVHHSYAKRYPTRVKKFVFYRSSLTGWRIPSSLLRADQRRQYALELVYAKSKRGRKLSSKQLRASTETLAMLQDMDKDELNEYLDTSPRLKQYLQWAVREGFIFKGLTKKRKPSRKRKRNL